MTCHLSQLTRILHIDNGRGDRGHYRQSFPPDVPPSRNLYHGNPGKGSYRNGGGGPPNRVNYGHRNNRGRHEPRSVAPVQKLSYNKDGSIKWANKVADTSDQQQDQGQQQQQQDQDQQQQGKQDYGQYYGQDQQQQNGQSQGQYNDNYYGNRGNNGNSGNNGNNNYYGGSNSQQQSQQNDYYDSSNSYSGGNQRNNYYQEDQSDQYYGQENDNQNDYYSGQSNGNNDYGYSNNYNYGDNNSNYGYENRNSNDNNNNNKNQNSNNNQDNATKSKQNVTAGFAGGIRLAGAMPDDGYSRGQGTFYDLETRIGSCGKQNKNSEFVAALNTEQMGEDGRNNPNCGKDIEVVGPSGKSVQVTVVDSCRTCKSGGLDLSPAAYEEIGDFSHGSVPIKWKFV